MGEREGCERVQWGRVRLKLNAEDLVCTHSPCRAVVNIFITSGDQGHTPTYTQEEEQEEEMLMQRFIKESKQQGGKDKKR